MHSTLEIKVLDGKHLLISREIIMMVMLDAGEIRIDRKDHLKLILRVYSKNGKLCLPEVEGSAEDSKLNRLVFRSLYMWYQNPTKDCSIEVSHIEIV